MKMKRNCHLCKKMILKIARSLKLAKYKVSVGISWSSVALLDICTMATHAVTLD